MPEHDSSLAQSLGGRWSNARQLISVDEKTIAPVSHGAAGRLLSVGKWGQRWMRRERAGFSFAKPTENFANRATAEQDAALIMLEKLAGTAVWDVMLLVRSYKEDLSAVARHLKWPEVKVQAAVNYVGGVSWRNQ